MDGRAPGSAKFAWPDRVRTFCPEGPLVGSPFVFGLPVGSAGQSVLVAGRDLVLSRRRRQLFPVKKKDYCNF